MPKIAHIVNPVKLGPSSDLYTAQPVTFESMRVARQFARDEVDVELYATCYPEDEQIVPNHLKATPFLDQSVLDLGRFESQRKLPLLADILNRLYEASEAEYFIYSNVDIALLPYFYCSVYRLIELGYDAFVVNRRTISNAHDSINQLPLMYAEAGQAHPGHDCFVFRRQACQQYNLDQVCIGTSLVGRVLIWNMACFATMFNEFKDLHLTFHIGDDRSWQDPKLEDYLNHNRQAAKRVFDWLSEHHGPLETKAPLWSYIDNPWVWRELGIERPDDDNQTASTVSQSPPGLAKRLVRWAKGHLNNR